MMKAKKGDSACKPASKEHLLAVVAFPSRQKNHPALNHSLNLEKKRKPLL